jgi:hypothetical protein
MVNVSGVPGQLLKVGVTVMFPDSVVVVALVGAVQDAIFPDPLATKPINVLEFDQLNVAPAGVEANAAGAMLSPGQTSMLPMEFTSAIG